MRIQCKDRIIKIAVIFFLLFSLQIRVYSAGSTGITVGEAPEFEVHYTTGQATYVEALVDQQWVARDWMLDQDKPEMNFTEPAFEIWIKTSPENVSVLLQKGWTVTKTTQLPETSPNTRHFVVELMNSGYPVKVNVHTLLDGTSVFTRFLEITNIADKPIALTGLSVWSGQLWTDDAAFTVGHSISHWEGFFGWTPLEAGINAFSNHRGLEYDDPYFFLRNESNGEYFFGELAWTASWTMEFQKGSGLSFRFGPWSTNALRVIEAGETILTPAVHLGHVREDFDTAIQQMHTHIRRSILPKRHVERAYRIQYLFPEDQLATVYRGDECNETNVKKLLDVCAAAGVELFILDGPTWAEGYGNWVPKKKWFPNGLEPLREYAHKKGLLFGLYAEPEGGRGDWSQTQAFRQHPEWFEGKILNLAIPEAADYMESEWLKIIDNYKLDLYRHDINMGIRAGEGTVSYRQGFIECDYWRHYDALYEMTKRIGRKYPELILQQASGGCTRSDLAAVGAWDEHYTSDRAGYPWVCQMLSGLSVYLPPEILVSPHGMNGPFSDTTTMLRGIYTLGNTPMIFNAMLPKSIETFPEQQRQPFLHYARLYKSFIRPLLADCKVYHHAPVNAGNTTSGLAPHQGGHLCPVYAEGGVESGGWFAMEFDSPDMAKGWATIIRLSDNKSNSYLFKPRGLDLKKTYKVTFDNTGKVETLDAAKLMQNGLEMRFETGPCSQLLLFEATQ